MNNIKSFQKFMIDNGLIFEINRKVLHPLGLALVVDIDRENKKRLAFTAISTDDETGFIYDEEAFIVGTESFQKFMDAGGQERLDARKEKYGFIEQDKADLEK